MSESRSPPTVTTTASSTSTPTSSTSTPTPTPTPTVAVSHAQGQEEAAPTPTPLSLNERASLPRFAPIEPLTPAATRFQRPAGAPAGGVGDHPRLSRKDRPSQPRFSRPTLTSVTSPVNAAKYKTQICRSFEDTGSCPFNSKCLFAHGQKELRSPCMNLQRPSLARAASLRRTSSSATSATTTQVNALVVSMQTSMRRFTPSFALGVDPKMINACPRHWSTGEGDLPVTEQKAAVLYKTELCRSWANNGQCPYGGKCQFAHGESEIRPVDRHKNYKTTKCEKFHTTGSCRFGLRCIFIHDEDERELLHSDSFDPKFASEMRLRRASEQFEKIKIEEDEKGLDGEFLRERFNEKVSDDAETN